MSIDSIRLISAFRIELLSAFGVDVALIFADAPELDEE